MHTLTILPRESYLRHRWNKDGICERCGFDGASFMLWMRIDEARAYHDSRFPTCEEEMMTNFETMQLDSTEIPEACRDAYRAQIGAWPAPGERDPMAAVWAMAWLSKPEAANPPEDTEEAANLRKTLNDWMAKQPSAHACDDVNSFGDAKPLDGIHPQLEARHV